MNQKKHLNAIAALEASKDAKPGNLWQRAYCDDAVCERCYGIKTLCRGIINCSGLGLRVSEVRAALQSSLDAYNKRKAEKAERQDEGEAIHTVMGGPHNPPSKEPAPLIPDPPDTPEVRAIMEHISTLQIDDMCGYENCSSACPFEPVCGDEKDRQARHAFALSWLSRHPAGWDAKKGRFTLADRHARMRKWAEAVIKHYPIPDEGGATVWLPGMMDSRLLADEVIAYLADEALRQGWKR